MNVLYSFFVLLTMLAFTGCGGGGGGGEDSGPAAPAGPIDFALELVPGDGVLLTGETGQLTVTLSNLGEASAPTQVELSVPGSGVLLVDPIDSLAAGETIELTYDLTFTVAGTITVFALADPDDSVDETDEDNNSVTAVFQVLALADG